MDYMDIDEVLDIPDTPDRLAAQNINGRPCIELESDSPVVSHSGNTGLFDEGARNQLRGRSKSVLDNGQSRRMFFRSGKNLSVSNNSEADGGFTIPLMNSSSSENACMLGKGKALSTPQSPILGENDVVDLTEWRRPPQVFNNGFPNGALDDCQAIETREGSISTNGFSFSRGIADSSTTALNSYKGKEKLYGACKGSSGIDLGKGTFSDSRSNVGKNMSSSFHSILSPRVGGQKKLARHGFISPLNIAKAEQLAENHSNGSMDIQNDRGSVSDCSLDLVMRDLTAEEDNSSRRQGVIIHPSSPQDPDVKSIDLATRSSITQNEDTSGTSNADGDAFRCCDTLGGWRSTRNRTKKINLPLSDEGQHLSRTKNDPFYVNRQNENNVVRRDNGKVSSSRIGNDYHEDHNAVSFHHGSALNEAQAVSHPMSESFHVSGHHAATSTLMKRQRQGSASSNHGESSTLARNQSGGPRILDPLIEIDEFSPEMRHFGSHNTGFSPDGDSDDRARQVEADEMLARELQQQLYNEAPIVEEDDIDALVSALEREETSQHAYSSGSHPVFHPRGSWISNSYRQSQSTSSQNPSIRRGTNARVPASDRLTRLRSRLPSPPPRISYRESSPIFPPHMDLDMRMHILEALEAFSDMEMAGNFPEEVEREFNENDYEMLLALDENNHQHGGASLAQINSLPQSTVQGDNFDEACVICLETPTSGDTIRHLPCLHKFHKDCIDPWLRRKRSCPVCKSSIT